LELSLLKQKILWIGGAAVFVALIIFGLAMMGSVLGAKAKALPVALVVLDQPLDLPTGEKIALGELVKQKVTELDQLPINWITMDSESDVQVELEAQNVYGALIIPADFSRGVLSIQSPSPVPSTIKQYLNEGMNSQAASAVKTMLNQMMDMMQSEISQNLLSQIGEQAEQLPIHTAKALLTPFHIEEIVVHAVGSNNGNGTAPNILTQVIWIGSLICSIFLFLAVRNCRQTTDRRFAVVAVQLIVGLVLTAAASGFTVWMANTWYGMHISNPLHVWLFLWLVAAAFFLLQSALLSWIGFPAIGLLVLLLFFSLPLLNMAPEFMSQTTQDWLYSWTPLRYAAAGLRTIMYYGGEGMSLAYRVMWWIAAVAAVVLLASSARKEKTDKQKTGLLSLPTSK